MKKVQLWKVLRNDTGDLVAKGVPSVENTETEELFETLLVRSPELLVEGLKLIGRQVPTGGGPLDLLGVDQDGRLIVFELKRGSLTRAAVAQILDYTSDLETMDPDRFAKLIEESSGHGGIDKIEDFANWYSETFPDRDGVLEESPRMVLVGLGADSRALRIVNFLARAGIDVSLLTFNAFKQGEALFLAKQVESVPPKQSGSEGSGSQTKEGNLQVLRSNASQRGVSQVIEEVADFVEQRTPAYKWPGKNGYAFSLTEYTEQGRPSLRVYVNISIDWEKLGSLRIVFPERAVHAAGASISAIKDAFPDQCFTDKYNGLCLHLAKDNWNDLKSPFESVLQNMVQGWKKKTSEQQTSATQSVEAEESGPDQAQE